MKSFLFIITIAVAVYQVIDAALPLDDTDNTISSIDNGRKPSKTSPWVQIEKPLPTRIVHQVGTPLELECDVVGSPAPEITWVRGSSPMVNAEQFNAITETVPTRFGQASSRLILDHLLPGEQTFTCVGRAGSKMVYETITVHFTASEHAKGPETLINLLAMTGITGRLNPVRKPKIVQFYRSLFSLIGSNVVLPCKTSGRPTPEVYWLDANDDLINASRSSGKYQILPNGDLFINNLVWDDMGNYSCVARNGLGKDKISTFIYPLKPED